MSHVIITIHGVGVATAGETLAGIQQNLALPDDADAGYESSDLALDRGTYKRLRPRTAGAPELVEVNWSDVRKPGSSIVSRLLYLPALAIAALDLDYAWLRCQPAPGWLGRAFTESQRVYRWTLESLVLWAIFPVLLALGYGSLDGRDCLWFALALILLVAGMAGTVRNWGPWMAKGSLAMLAVLVGLTLSLEFGWVELSTVTRVSAFIYGLTQFAATALLLVLAGVAGIAVMFDPKHWARYLAFLAMNYLPLVLFAAFGSCLWAITLNGLHYTGRAANRSGALISQEWSEIFLSSIGYDLTLVEFAMAAATLGIGLLFAMHFAYYWLVLRSRVASRHSAGDVARRGYRALLVEMPLLLLIPTAVLFLTCPLSPVSTKAAALLSIDVLTIYTIASLRFAALLPLAAPHMATLLGVIGDVVFYTARPATALSTRQTCNERLAELLQFYCRQSDVTSISVVSHSQGSVIAYEVLRNFSAPDGVAIRLVTMGSPLDALYHSFLGFQFAEENLPCLEWFNLYRNGDYIGGSIPQLPQATDIDLGPGEHTGYWSDPRIAQYVSSQQVNQPLAT